MAHQAHQWDEVEDCSPFRIQLHECSFMEFHVISPRVLQKPTASPAVQPISGHHHHNHHIPVNGKGTDVHIRDEETGPVDNDSPIIVKFNFSHYRNYE